MRNTFIYIGILLFCNLTLIAQNYRGGVGIHPIHNKISWRSNIHKKHFWDYKIQYQAGSVSGVPFINLTPQVNSCWRRQNNEQLKFYWGLGLGLETFVPRFAIPLGIEIIPFAKSPQLTLVTEASPILILLGPGMTTTTIKGDLSIILTVKHQQNETTLLHTFCYCCF